MLSIIVAIAKNNCIGIKGKLPWNIPEDLEYFKKTTLNKTVIMGKNTFESILSYLGKPLPNRKNIVVALEKDYQVPVGVILHNSLNEAIASAKNEDAFIIGGASIYAQAFPLADKLYITHVNQTVDGDAFFPVIDKTQWREEWREDHDGFSFVRYIKK